MALCMKWKIILAVAICSSATLALAQKYPGGMASREFMTIEAKVAGQRGCLVGLDNGTAVMMRYAELRSLKEIAALVNNDWTVSNTISKSRNRYLSVDKDEVVLHANSQDNAVWEYELGEGKLARIKHKQSQRYLQ